MRVQTKHLISVEQHAFFLKRGNNAGIVDFMGTCVHVCEELSPFIRSKSNKSIKTGKIPIMQQYLSEENCLSRTEFTKIATAGDLRKSASVLISLNKLHNSNQFLFA